MQWLKSFFLFIIRCQRQTAWADVTALPLSAHGFRVWAAGKLSRCREFPVGRLEAAVVRHHLLSRLIGPNMATLCSSKGGWEMRSLVHGPVMDLRASVTKGRKDNEH